MEVSILRPQDLSCAELSAWRQLQAANSTLDNAFFSPEFAAAVGHCRPGTAVATVRDGGDIVAFLPFEHRHLGIGQAVGYGVSDAQGLICCPELAMDPVRLVRACRLGVWDFDHLVFRLDRLTRWTYDVTSAPVMDVSGGYKAYLHEDDRCHHRLFRSIMQKRRKLEREHGELNFVFESADASALTALMDWKSEQYHRTGHFDRFSRRWIRELVGRLATCDGPGCQGTLSTLSVGERLIAVHFGIRTTTRMSLWFPAYDPSFGQYSPGLQLFLSMAEAAPDHGVELLDLGKGNEPYKASFASWNYPVASGRVQATHLASFARRLEVRGERTAEELVVSHPHIRSLLPDSLSRVDRVH
jgi:CelD/BcsL family acetyltransferase involved in cellulose biosynthesis